jgi:hypothetical protein
MPIQYTHDGRFDLEQRLSPVESVKLAVILARLSSPYAGERAAAELLAGEFIKARGLLWCGVFGRPRRPSVLSNWPPLVPKRPGIVPDVGGRLCQERRSMSRVVPLRPEPAPAHVEIISVNVIQRGGLLAHVDARFGALTIFDCPVVLTGGHYWCGLPGRPQLGRDGVQMKRPSTGKGLFTPMAKWSSSWARDRFSSAVIEAIRQAYPGALPQTVDGDAA